MGRLIEEQAVIDCLTNTAKYYDMPQADEWTKGIHYGLLHGLDNILDNVPTVEAIPKDQIKKFLEEGTKDVGNNVLAIVREDYIHKADYEKRLKADLVAMLVDLQLEIEELDSRAGYGGDGMPTFSTDYIRKKKVNELVQQKINKLKGENK